MSNYPENLETGTLEQRAAEVLARNDCGDHTVPQTGMYPHQWLWDSALTAIGMRHLDPRRAALEVDTIMRGQWANGMVPNMQFAKGRLGGNPPFKPDYLLWSSRLLNKHAPRDVPTSGITQPPIIAEAALLVGEKLDHDDRTAFWKRVATGLVDYHNWIYRERNLNGDGLFTAVHPWETGMEDTPAWMVHMRALDWGLLGNTIKRSGSVTEQIGRRIRRDAKETASEERATPEEGLLYMSALQRLIRTRYDYRKLYDSYPLHVQDVHMNNVLIRNNEVLQQLASETKSPVPEELAANMALTRQNIESLWDEDARMYFPRDGRNLRPIKVATVASLMPLYAGSLSTERKQRLLEHAADPESFGLPFGVPTVPQNSPFYREEGYWSGPTWVNMNWLLADGLRRLGNQQESTELTQSTLAMVAVGGMREYYSAKTARGLGAPNFSWTAALSIDMSRQLAASGRG